MKKYIRIITAVTIALVVSLSAMLSACGKDTPEKASTTERETYEGTHIYTATETNKPFVSNGKTDYTLVIPADASDYLLQAKNEFMHLFKQATGISLNVVNDTGLTYNDEVKYISIGKTALMERAGVKAERSELGRDGGRIVTKGNSIFICGGSDKGTLYTVYTFMQITFDFEQYYIDCYEINRNVKNMNLKSYDVTDIPDMAIRPNGSGLLGNRYGDYDKDNFGTRLKMGTGIFETIMPIHKELNNIDSAKAQAHNTFHYLPPEQYGTNTDWYSDSGKQLCFTAHGKTEEVNKMVELCAEKVINSLKLYKPDEYPLYEVAHFMIQDGEPACTCKTCVEMNNKYESNAAAVIIFVNKVAEKVDEWMKDPANAEYLREDFHILICAYQSYEAAPADYDEKTGKYTPKDENVKFHPLVGLQYAPMNALDYQSSLFDEVNELGRKSFDAWNCLSDFTYYWLYATNFQYYNYMYDSFNFYTSDMFAYLANRSAKSMLAQQQHDQSGTSTAWHNLKFYLTAKLSWDTSLNDEELINNWFNAMYKEAAPVMKDLFYSQRAWAKKEYTDAELIHVNSVYNKVANREYWPYATLRGWIDQFPKAVEAIEKYKTQDPELYGSICDHIAAEWISPAYTLLDLWNNGTLKEDEKAELIEQFKKVLDRVDPNGLMQYTDYTSTYRSFIDGL